MVSNTLNMELEELVQILERWREKYGADLEYQKLRKELPDNWPI